MPIQRLPLGLAALVLCIFAIPALAAPIYKFTLPSDVSIGNTKLKSGEYTVSIEGKQAVFKRGGKQVAQIPVDVEKSDHKFSDTTFEMTKDSLRVINLRGTDTMLVFEPPQ
jgi:hypothetical protein